MSATRHTWLLFGACLAIGLTAMVWLSVNALRFDRLHDEQTRKTDQEERIRLALWRMDSALALILAELNALPWTAFSTIAPVERALSSHPQPTPLPPNEILTPSPLLLATNAYARLHFELSPSGSLQSPQVPSATHATVLQQLGVDMTPFLQHPERLASLEAILARATPTPEGPPLQPSNRDTLTAAATSAIDTAATDNPADRRDHRPPSLASKASTIPTDRRLRDTFLDQALFQNSSQNRGPRPPRPAPGSSPQNPATATPTAETTPQSRSPAPPSPSPATHPPRIGYFAPAWIAGNLFLARRVDWEDRHQIQGCWLDWPAIRTQLEALMTDLLPAANVLPEPGPRDPADPLFLAALPLKLDPGNLVNQPTPGITPLRVTLLFAWLAASLSAGAVALLLQGAVNLSERRAAFVAAVTHELRTPLTTFKLYTDMLADGTPLSPEQRTAYLSTLRAEADRLGHLVENVLAFARLERGSARSRTETISTAELIGRLLPRLQQHIAHSQGTLETRLEPDVAQVPVIVDVHAIDQILFNLVDNASKYAPGSPLHLSAESGPRSVRIRLRDHGPGVSRDVVHRLFEPFSKSADEAARSAPGVGLGLSLSRRLARSLGGDLWLDPHLSPGACFVLSLPTSLRGHTPREADLAGA